MSFHFFDRYFNEVASSSSSSSSDDNNEENGDASVQRSSDSVDHDGDSVSSIIEKKRRQLARKQRHARRRSPGVTDAEATNALQAVLRARRILSMVTPDSPQQVSDGGSTTSDASFEAESDDSDAQSSQVETSHFELPEALQVVLKFWPNKLVCLTYARISALA